MIGVKTTVTMERILYLDLPDDSKEEDIIKSAEKEIILPTIALSTATQTLRNLHINIPNLDLNDWDVKDVKREILK